jgi:hypothetical protein
VAALPNEVLREKGRQAKPSPLLPLPLPRLSTILKSFAPLTAYQVPIAIAITIYHSHIPRNCHIHRSSRPWGWRGDQRCSARGRKEESWPFHCNPNIRQPPRAENTTVRVDIPRRSIGDVLICYFDIRIGDRRPKERN